MGAAESKTEHIEPGDNPDDSRTERTTSRFEEEEEVVEKTDQADNILGLEK